ncbi:MAG: DNA polymerase III subunit gamma/tau [Bacteroidetes bacterium]|nr:DNA polymerase III subunit gamma/tau [Bacteroidota bacterium]
MEHFVVSARKYRPQGFDQVVGQKSITRTLENAISNNHLAQALLFTGPRGVGKTTCARILAKKINQDSADQQNAAAHPDEDFAFNIFELDAASNNSVEDIRSLIDQVRIPPQTGRFKVYIIDEVHMLSSAAFNAFLKTLEEPPAHAIFILATTEKHKIIPTILSRCQIFDFKRITVEDIKEQLQFVAQAEGIQAEDDALHLMALKADGAMRDALSIFDRIVSFCGHKISRTAVAENLHILDYAYYFSITDLMLQGSIPDLLLQLDEILAQGFDGQHFINGLCSHFRDLLVAQTPQTIRLLEVGENVKQDYARQSQAADRSWLLSALDIANQCALSYRNSRNPRLLVELCLMQLASLNDLEQKKKPTNQPYIIPARKLKARAVVEPAAIAVAEPEASVETEPVASVVAEPEIPVVDEPKSPASPESAPTAEAEPARGAPDRGAKPDKPRKIDLKIEGVRAGVSSLSLKSIQEKRHLQAQQKASGPAPGVKRNKEFNAESFLSAWNTFANQIKEEGKFNLHSHLTMETPVLKGTDILLTYPNDTIRLEVERDQGALLAFLANELENDHLKIKITVVESAVKRYAYTPEEKYAQLKEQNPLLDVLRSSLDLDV